MNISRLVAELGPVFVQQQISSMVANGQDPSFFEEHGAALVNGLSDALREKEVSNKKHGKADFVAHLAADLLHGWHGEPTEQAAVEAVRIAKRIIDEAEKLYPES